MSVDFFDSKCLTKTSETEFGIRDGVNEEMVYLDFTNKAYWICTVLNENKTKIKFRAVDKCVIILRENGDKEKSCDAILTYGESIDFIELKNQRGEWIKDGREQLEKTIELFILNHGLENFKHKRAFVLNKKHPDFHVIENEIMIRFFRKYKVRLNVEATIIIK